MNDMLTYDASHEEFLLPSGGTAYASGGLLSIRPELTVFQGYDGPFEPFGYGRVFSEQDRAAIAREMIQRWAEWGRVAVTLRAV